MRKKHRKKTGGQQAILHVFVSSWWILAGFTMKARRREESRVFGCDLLLVFPCRGEIIGRTILPSIQNDGMLTGGATWRGERFHSVFAEPRAS